MTSYFLHSQIIFSFIIFIIGYFITITFSEVFQSKAAKLMGDNTPEMLGYSSLNPLDHFNLFYFIFLLWMRVSIPNILPIDIHNFNPQRTLKIILFLFSSTLASFILTLTSLTISAFLIGFLNTAKLLIMLSDKPWSVSLDSITSMLGSTPSLILVIGLILNVVAYLNIVIIIYSIVLNSFKSIFYLIYKNINFNNLLIFIPIIILVFFGGKLSMIVMDVVLTIETKISYLLGIL